MNAKGLGGANQFHGNQHVAGTYNRDLVRTRGPGAASLRPPGAIPSESWNPKRSRHDSSDMCNKHATQHTNSRARSPACDGIRALPGCGLSRAARCAETVVQPSELRSLGRVRRKCVDNVIGRSITRKRGGRESLQSSGSSGESTRGVLPNHPLLGDGTSVAACAVGRDGARRVTLAKRTVCNEDVFVTCYLHVQRVEKHQK